MPSLSLSRSTGSKAAELTRYIEDRVWAVNVRVGQVRALFITDIPGQDPIYKAKQEEAEAYLLEDPEPLTLDGYTFLAKEIGITADTPLELAQLWVTMRDQWEAIGSDLEAIRLGFIKEIRAATTKAEVDALVAEFETYMEGVSP